ncbi:MAG: polysaccharide biosynthesis/export family protein [Bacteroides sp.]|nr:polysaccharide biosynthesis/export family protein [Bacteroides sp.]MCM1413262.1 polysaccharide biosynthesis/export family protein [Bacteroides sp.]MCM1471428.1 polysaccharide biosynthesis/export family protein [Bacteroides sp.]
MKKTSFILLLFLSIISSCKTKHDLSYFEDLLNSQSGTLATPDYTYRLEPENELIINVTSSVPQASAQFNLPYTNTAVVGTTQMTSTPQVKTYEIDNKGDIDFPVLGKIHVAGMTTYEVKEYLEKRISEYVKDPIVTVSLRGYQISVIGEVGTPRTIITSADRYSILNALADCGDLTEYGKRENVLVMRRTANGDIEYGRLNLHDSNITQSPYFWLRNNDVVIVDPNPIKQDNSKYNQNSAYKLSIASTIVGLSASVISLIIALAVK